MFARFIYPLLTAPGVMVHELGHALFCLLARVRIHKMKLFQFGRVAGFVNHDEPAKFYQTALISFGPLLLNSFLTLICFARLVPPYTRISVIFFGWLGAAIGLHAIPSTGDAKTLLAVTNRRVFRNPLIILGYPLVLALYVLNLLRRLHLDVIYVAVLFWLGNIYLKA